MDARSAVAERSNTEQIWLRSIHTLFSHQKQKHDVVAGQAEQKEEITVRDVTADLHKALPPSVYPKPGYAVIDTVAKYLFELSQFEDEFKCIDKHLKHIILLLKEVCIDGRRDIVLFESRRSGFDIDIDLHELKTGYMEKDRDAQDAFSMQLSKYQIKMDNLRDDIKWHQQQLSALNVATSTEQLRKLEIYSVTMQEIDDQIATASREIGSVGFLQHFFCYTPKRVRHAYSVVNRLEGSRSLLAGAAFDAIKQDLYQRIQIKVENKRAALRLLEAEKPECNLEFRRKQIEVEARVRSDEFEYYSSVNHEFMFDLLKIYFIIRKIVTYLSREQSNNESAVELINLPELFTRLMETYKQQVAGFYCEEPGRYYFDDYLKNMQQIDDNDTLNDIIVGGATDDQQRQVIPAYKSHLPTPKITLS